MKRYLTIINLLLLTVTLYFGVKIFYVVTTAQLDKRSDSRANSQMNSASAQMTSFPFSYYESIIERNLFKTKKEALQNAGKIDVENLKQTELKLRLFGTVTGGDPSAYAVIEDVKERRQNLYKVGDAVQSATLKMILRERVILSVGGQDEVLEIEKASSSGSRTSSRARGRTGSRTSRPSPPAQTTKDPKTQRINLKRSLLDEATGNMNQLMKDVSLQPHFEDGKANGIRLSRIKRNSIFRKMGLRRGDIITGVDGQSIESVDDALGLYDSLKSASSVKLEIKRRGQPRVLDYNIQ